MAKYLSLIQQKSTFRQLVYSQNIRFVTEVEAVEVVELPCAVMPTKQKHHIFIYSGRCAISALGPYTISTICFHIDLAPLPGSKVEPVKIVSVMTIIPSKYVHAVFIDDSRMRMAWCWCATIQLHLLHHLLPSVIVYRVFVEIIHSVESVISTKDVD